MSLVNIARRNRKGRAGPLESVARPGRFASRTFLLVAGAGTLPALVAAFLLNRPNRPQPPAFQPANPYAQAIYANGVIESDQTSGENINFLPEVSASVPPRSSADSRAT